MNRIEQAIVYATLWHQGQCRKGTDTPYITHPLKTMSYLIAMDADEDLVIAGLLHDVLEDTNTQAEEIEKLFGENVVELVTAHSENKSLPWKRRKEMTIDECKHAPRAVRMLIMADTMANLADTVEDVAKHGDNVWNRFNTTKDKQAWYYWNKVLALQDLTNDDPDINRQYDKMNKMCYEVFGMPSAE